MQLYPYSKQIDLSVNKSDRQGDILNIDIDLDWDNIAYTILHRKSSYVEPLSSKRELSL